MTNTFTFNGNEYTMNEKGYCYKFNSDKKVRIPKAEYEQAKADAKAEAEKADTKKAPKAKAKKAKKNAAFTATVADVTLTQKQVDFLNRIPAAEEFVQGAESTFYTDLYCDTVADIMNAMVVGAIISTLREKNLIYIGQGKVNGKKCKFFGFTDLGKAIIKELGLV